jgi:hypothetical protein
MLLPRKVNTQASWSMERYLEIAFPAIQGTLKQRRSPTQGLPH